MKSFKSEDSEIIYFETPWNSRVLGGSTLEISRIVSENLHSEKTLIQKFREFLIDKKFKLAAVRVPATETSTIGALVAHGFRIIEHTLDVSSSNLKSPELTDIVNRFKVDVVDFRDEHIREIKSISGEHFHYGRFFEDPKIDISVAKKRNILWIDDLIQNNSLVKVLIKNEKPVGFMVYKLEPDNSIQLQLGGVHPSFQHLSYAFWASVLNSFPDGSSVHTTISSSNVSILNLYSYFRFRFLNPSFGLHLLLD